MNSLVINEFKNSVNKHYKMIGYKVTNNRVVFNECRDEVITFKFFCDKTCQCDNLLEAFRSFTIRNNIFYEHKINSIKVIWSRVCN